MQRDDGSGSDSHRSSWQQRPQGRGNNRTSGVNNQNKDGGRQQGLSSVSGNAWKGKGAPGAQASTPAPASTTPAEQHVPLRDFNAGEVKDFLKKSKRIPCLEASLGAMYFKMVLRDPPHPQEPQLTCTQSTLRPSQVHLPHDITSVTAPEANRAFPGHSSAYHKVQGDSVAKRSHGAWGSKGTYCETRGWSDSTDTAAGNMPHLMPSGQDFFTQLKKQLATLDQSK